MHLLLTKFYMYLENIILQFTNTKTRKISPKGTFQRWFGQKNKTLTKSTQNRQGTLGHWSMSSPRPATQRRWRCGLVMDRLVLGGIRLSLSFLWRWHGFMLRRCIPCLHAKDSQKHRLGSSISKGVTPCLNTHSTWATSHNTTTSFSSCSFYFLSCLE
jgi:hypothetical protein